MSFTILNEENMVEILKATSPGALDKQGEAALKKSAKVVLKALKNATKNEDRIQALRVYLSLIEDSRKILSGAEGTLTAELSRLIGTPLN